MNTLIKCSQFVALLVVCVLGFQVKAQVTFTSATNFSISAAPTWVTAADVNGDGKSDLITVNSGANTLTVLTNNGSSGYVLSLTMSAPGGPGCVAAADVNGDGWMDLIRANGGGNTLSVLTNNHSGGFVLASTLTVGSYPYYVLAVDINKDGWVDLISANNGTSTLSVYTNNRSGGFILSSTLAVGSGPNTVVAADVNHDGWLDLISANYNNSTLSVLTNNHSGGFVLASSPSVGANPYGCVAADVNGDGWIDLVSSSYEGGSGSTLSVLTNNGSGGFVLSSSPVVNPAPLGVIAADINGDGKIDLICPNYGGNTLSILTNNGSGSFALALKPSVGASPNSVMAVDLNGDGRPDLICSDYSGNSVSVLLNTTGTQIVLANPASVTNNLGDNVVLSIGVSGGTPLDFQWRFSGTNVDNGTNSTLNITNISQPFFGNYQVVVTNAFASFISSVATIYEPATILGQPGNVVVPLAGTASFTVAAVGYPAPNYQWTFNGTNLSGATSNSLTISRVNLAETGNYQVLVSNAISTATSSVASLDMSPSITVPFIGATPIWGQSATFAVGAVGNGTLTYQWYFNGQPIPNAVNPNLDFSSIQLTNIGFYSVVISSAYGSVTNTAYQVAVTPSVVALGFYPGLTITGGAGDSYLIQRSADLSNTNNWQTISSLTMTQSVELWVDTNIDASSPFNHMYFYQLVPQ